MAADVVVLLVVPPDESVTDPVDGTMPPAETCVAVVIACAARPVPSAPAGARASATTPWVSRTHSPQTPAGAATSTFGVALTAERTRPCASNHDRSIDTGRPPWS